MPFLSVIQLREQGHTTLDPVLFSPFGTQLDCEDEVGGAASRGQHARTDLLFGVEFYGESMAVDEGIGSQVTRVLVGVLG